MAQVLHLTGPVLVGPDDARPQAWVVGGRMTYAAPTGDHDVTTVPGWVLPGLVDAHSHIGLGAHGAVDDATADHPGLRARVVGADEDGTGEVQHLSHGPTLAAGRAPTPWPRADGAAHLI